MGKLILKKGMPECDWHNDQFKLHSDFGVVEDNQKYWNALCEELPKISKKYRNTDMSRWVDTTLIAFADYLNSKVANPMLSDAEAIARIVSVGRSKEEIEAIIKALQKGVEG